MARTCVLFLGAAPQMMEYAYVRARARGVAWGCVGAGDWEEARRRDAMECLFVAAPCDVPSCRRTIADLPSPLLQSFLRVPVAPAGVSIAFAL
jgi:hypothetical protein